MVNDARDSAETAASDDPSALGTKGDLERLRTEISGEFREELERANEERLYEKADASYYFRVQTMLMYDPLTARTLANFVAVLVLILLQVFSLTCIWQMSWLATDWARLVEKYDFADEKLQSAYRAGLPYPSSFHDMLDGHDSVYLGLPLLIIGPTILCGLAVSLLTLSGEVEQLKAGYVMMRREWSLADPAATRPRAAEHAFRIGACSLISILRASLVWFYFEIVGLMMGSADGPFNLLLNALAMGFVLELDDVLQPDLPSQNFFGVNHPRLFQLYDARDLRGHGRHRRQALRFIGLEPAHEPRGPGLAPGPRADGVHRAARALDVGRALRARRLDSHRKAPPDEPDAPPPPKRRSTSNPPPKLRDGAGLA